MKISVVIPAFNVEPWIGSAIESVLRQDAPSEEVIVVDDGSTDRTAKVAEGFPTVRLLSQENRGLAAARNAGAEISTGDALLFLDADDVLLPGAILALSCAADDAGEWGAVIPNYVPLGTGRRRLAWAPRPARRILARRGAAALIRANHLAPNSLVTKQAWRRHPFWEDLPTSEDLDFWLRLILAGERLVILGAPLVAKRVDRPGALSTRRVMMRAGRRAVFEHLRLRDDLMMLERLLVAYQLVRVSVGEVVARRAEGETSTSARGHLFRSPSSLVRATGITLGVPGLLPALRVIDTFRHN